MKLMNRLAIVAVCLMLVPLASAQTAKDWPQFHGSSRDNISKETGLLKSWGDRGPALAWRNLAVGAGYSSVSVVNGKIFTAGEEGGSSYVYCLNEAGGTQIWKSKLGRDGGGGGYPGPRATPTVDGDSLYMIGQHGDLVCYAINDGREIWRTNLNERFGGKMMSGWGNSESLIIEGNNVLCTPGGRDGTVLALDKKTGAQVWRSKDFTDSAAYMGPVVTEIAGVRQAVVLTDKSVAGIDVKDGNLLWRAERPGQTAVIPTPVIKGNLIFVTSGYGVGCDLFKVEKQGDKFAASKVYSNKNMINHHGGVILIGDLVYGYCDGAGGRRRPGQPAPAPAAPGNVGWTCLDLATGNVKFSEGNVAGITKGTLSYADGRFYLRDERKGTIALVEPTAGKFEVRGSFEQPNRTSKMAWPHLVIANGKLYVRDQEQLLCYDIKGK